MSLDPEAEGLLQHLHDDDDEPEPSDVPTLFIKTKRGSGPQAFLIGGKTDQEDYTRAEQLEGDGSCRRDIAVESDEVTLPPSALHTPSSSISPVVALHTSSNSISPVVAVVGTAAVSSAILLAWVALQQNTPQGSGSSRTSSSTVHLEGFNSFFWSRGSVMSLVSHHTNLLPGCSSSDDSDGSMSQDLPAWWCNAAELKALAGTLMGYSMTLFYLGARLPQIYRNFVRKSSEGV
jgi:hypothetical protein